MIGMHVKNRGMKNRKILLEGVFGFVQKNIGNQYNEVSLDVFLLCFFYENRRIGNFHMVFLPPFLPVNPMALRC